MCLEREMAQLTNFPIANRLEVSLTGLFHNDQNRHGTKRRNRAAGRSMKKASSKSKVKSNSRHDTLTRGPNCLSASNLDGQASPPPESVEAMMPVSAALS